MLAWATGSPQSEPSVSSRLLSGLWSLVSGLWSLVSDGVYLVLYMYMLYMCMHMHNMYMHMYMHMCAARGSGTRAAPGSAAREPGRDVIRC